jgi:hypothetical protein
MKRERSDSGNSGRQPPNAKAAGDKPPKQTAAGDKPGEKKKAAPARAARPAAAPKKAARPAATPRKPAATAATVKPAAAASRAKTKAAAAAPPTRRAEKPAKPAAPPKPAPAAKARAPRVPRPAPAARKVEADFSDEQRIESAKYEIGERPARVFEEERFIFPETYGQNRLRLLVKDPQWLFAHWDVDPAVISGLRAEMGERAAALSRLTLKVEDPEHGGSAVIHLPEDARSWYVRADRVRRAYRAELGLTLPSGEYRLLATSNTVHPPAGSASPRRATRKVRYEGARRPLPVEPVAEWPRAESAPPLAPALAASAPAAATAAPGPWRPKLPQPWGAPADEGDEGRGGPEKGGASDLHRR